MVTSVVEFNKSNNMVKHILPNLKTHFTITDITYFYHASYIHAIFLTALIVLTYEKNTMKIIDQF